MPDRAGASLGRGRPIALADAQRGRIVASSSAIAALSAAGAYVIGGVSVAAPVVGAGLCSLLLLFGVSRWLLPVIAVGAMALLPLGAVIANPWVQSISLFSVVMLAFVVRSPGSRTGPSRAPRRPFGSARALFALVILSAMSILWSDAPKTSLLWTLSLATVGVGYLAREEAKSGIAVATAIACLCTVLGVYALVEFKLQTNLLYGPFYATSPFPIEQHWSTYRVTTSLGHPLVNGTVFAVFAVLCLGWLMKSRRLIFGLGFLFGTLAVALTVSRSGIAAWLAGCLFLSWRSARGRGKRGLGLGLLLAAVIAAAYLLWGRAVLETRLNSSESAGSSETRVWMYRYLLDTLRVSNYGGVGAGMSGRYIGSHYGFKLPLESALLQVTASLGVLGLGLLFVFVGSLIHEGIAVKKPEVAAAALSFIVSISGYNALEDSKTILGLLGLIVFLLCGTPRDCVSRTEEIESVRLARGDV